MGDKGRKVIGFDNFKGLTSLSEQDGSEDRRAGKVVGGWNASDFREEFYELLRIFHDDAFAPWAKRIIVVEGDVLETITEFVENNLGLRISLFHLDLDLYEPTKVALENLWPLLVKGGIMVLDEYALMQWSGESRAVEEYFGPNMPELHTFNWVVNPNCYIVKK